MAGYDCITPELPGEIWLPIPGYEYVYDVSNFGRVRRNKTSNVHSGRILKPRVDSAGYYNIRFFRFGKQRNFIISRLVLATFIGYDPERPEANHIDGDKSNNALSNLEWVTRRENYDHAVRTGLKPPDGGTAWRQVRVTGERSGMSKLTTSEVHEIKCLLARGWILTRIAKKFGCFWTTIRAIKNEVTWRDVKHTCEKCQAKTNANS